MLFSTLFSAVLAFGAASVSATPAPKGDAHYSVQRGDQVYNVFEHAASGAKLEFIKNSSVCETSPGVNQYSGYLSVGKNMSMWFWFFEARNSPQTAPLSLWINGGPSCSSMIGLFQENGPCHFVNGSQTPSNNTDSWNNVANMLYVDQPIGTGFSYGTDAVNSTLTAAPYVWKLLQVFYASFPQYENRNFGLFTESYGGHYGPEFASYFQDQNQKIESGSAHGTKIPLVALGINNGWYDPVLQFEACITFAANNSYNKIITPSQASNLTETFQNTCLPALEPCNSLAGENDACMNGYNTCANDIGYPIIASGNFDIYDVREPAQDPYPPETYATYLNQSSIMRKIGAKKSYVECDNNGVNQFSSTGDDARSLLSKLGTVVESGIQVVIWAGDADWICNYQGGLAVANAIQWKGQAQFADVPLKSYTVGGKSTGLYKTLNNLSWLQVYGAGHEVPYYQPATALQVFQQTLSQKPLSGT